MKSAVSTEKAGAILFVRLPPHRHSQRRRRRIGLPSIPITTFLRDVAGSPDNETFPGEMHRGRFSM